MSSRYDDFQDYEDENYDRYGEDPYDTDFPNDDRYPDAYGRDD